MDFDKFTLVFLNGRPPSRERLHHLMKNPGRIVCADGGAQKALISGYKPDLIVGDLDSLDRKDGLPASTEIVKIDTQDNTDFEKTLDLLLRREMNDLLIVAFSGGRIDQTLANVQIAFEYSTKCNIVLADDDCVIFPVTGSFSGSFPPGTTVSILTMRDGTVVSTAGLKYGLSRKEMPRGGFGISNISCAETINVTVHEGGILLLIRDT